MTHPRTRGLNAVRAATTSGDRRDLITQAEESHDMRTHRAAAIWFLAALFVATGATVAFGHAEVRSTSPANGATAKTTIKRVTVTFTGQIQSGTLRVTGPGGKIVSVGTGGRDPRNVKRLLVGLKGTLKAGAYKASWKVAAPDGHAQHGSFGFTLRR
jgi:methionine-rich copper-binding protein CopC